MATLITKYRTPVTDTTGLVKLNEVKFTLEQVNNNTSGRLKLQLQDRTGIITMSLAGGTSVFERQINGEWTSIGLNVSVPTDVDLNNYVRIKVIGTSVLTISGTEYLKYWGQDLNFMNVNNGGQIFSFDNFGDFQPLITLDLYSFFSKIITFALNVNKLVNFNSFKNSRLESLIIDKASVITDSINATNFPNLKRLQVFSPFKTALPLSALPPDLKIIQFNQTNVAGDFAKYSNASGMSSVYVMSTGLNIANLANLPRCTSIQVGLENLSNGDYFGQTWKNTAYSGGFNWPNGMNRLCLGGFILNASAMDIILNELAALSWTGDGRKVVLQGKRTSASDAALSQLSEKEVIVNITQKDQI